MRLISITTIIVASVCVAVSFGDEKPVKDDKSVKFDAQKLLGKFVDIEGMKAGEKADPDRLKGQFVTITKDIFKIEGDKPEQTFEFAYKLNTSKDPVEIDLEIQYPDDLKGNKASGIISFDGKTLKLCYHSTEANDRPKKFESTSANNYFLWTMTKKVDK